MAIEEAQSRAEQQSQKLIQQLREDKHRASERVSQLMHSNQQMKRKIDELLSTTNRREAEIAVLKQQTDKLNEKLVTREQQYSNVLKKLEEAENDIANLKKKIAQHEGQLKSIKQNREVASSSVHNRSTNIMMPSTHLALSKLNQTQSPEDTKAIREVYADVERYLKHRILQMTNQLKSHRMSSRLEDALEGFLQQLMHINYLTVANFKKRNPPNADEDVLSMGDQNSRIVQNKTETSRFQEMNLVNVERLRLQKSIERLKSIESSSNTRKPRESEFRYRKESFEAARDRSQTRATANGNLSMLGASTTVGGGDHSRSRSRKRIFQ